MPVPLPRGIDAETSLSMDTLGDEWKVLGEVLQALRAHDGRIEDEISRLLQIYVPPEDEQRLGRRCGQRRSCHPRGRVDGTARPRRECGEPSGGASVA